MNVYVYQACLEKKGIHMKLFIIGEKKMIEDNPFSFIQQINFLNDNLLALIETKFNSLLYNFKKFNS